MTAPPGNAPGPTPAADAGAPAQVHAPSRVDTLVVGQDGSSLSGTALAGLAPLAERLGATLHVVSTVPRALDVDVRHAEVAAAADRWCRGLDVRHTVVAAPDPVAALHEMADRAGAVVCIGSHGAGCSACAVGSVAGDALARARHPLVVASVLADARVGQGVVACVDGGPSSAA
ncbi:MAG TPA: universal stress protein, partial [Acidimicrobiales bacterium]